jgi:hypothetical protein
MHTIFWLGNLKGRDHLRDLGVYVKISIGIYLMEMGGKVWTGLIWLRRGTNVRPF